MPKELRIRIISPLKATESDLARRQARYGDHARAGTQVTVSNLEYGPASLNSSGDILVSAYEIYRVGKDTTTAEFDAILIDCVFDPAVRELSEETGLPTFGPTKATLPLIDLVAENFSIVARTDRQCEILAETVEQYGYGDRVRSLRGMNISYEEAKQPETFDRVMSERLQTAVKEDGAQAVMFGSTTMALSDNVVAAASGIPLFMPGMVALRVIEHLWYDGLMQRPTV